LQCNEFEKFVKKFNFQVIRLTNPDFEQIDKALLEIKV
jgi:hypothetical protein